MFYDSNEEAAEVNIKKILQAIEKFCQSGYLTKIKNTFSHYFRLHNRLLAVDRSILRKKINFRNLTFNNKLFSDTSLQEFNI